MQIVKHGGLSGKARRARDRNRAARLHAQQMIEEYLEPGTATRPRREQRYIPIRSRNEFLPSATLSDGTAEPATDVPVRIIRPERSPASPVLKPPEQLKRKGNFTFGGFLFGCAMGSAAAALVLLVVHTVTG